MYGTTYRETPTSAPIDCEVISRARGMVVLREVGRPLPGVWCARVDQIVKDKVGGWTDARLANLRRDFEQTSLSLKQLAKLHCTSRGRISHIARRHKWTRHPDRRGRIGRIPGPQAAHQVAAP